jgi:hypothetical protein
MTAPLLHGDDGVLLSAVQRGTIVTVEGRWRESARRLADAGLVEWDGTSNPPKVPGDFAR